MNPTIVIFVLTVSGQASDAPAVTAPAVNPLYEAIRKEGFTAGDTNVSVPAPVLGDGDAADAEPAALRKIAGSENAVADLTRDSVAAPVIVKTRDQPAGDRGVIRLADLWFVVRAGLEDIEPEKAAGATGEGQTTEAANMRFTVRRLGPADLARRGITPGAREWYVHTAGRLLDRIQVDATDKVVAARSARSWWIATRTDRAFDDDKGAPNRWHPIARKVDREEAGKPEIYPGGVSYLKISLLETVPGALLVEAHFAFFEPRAWFDGAPILRSKIGAVAQDRVRGLRRELAKSHKAEQRRSSSGPKGG